MRKSKVIAQAKRNQNLFTLDLTLLEKTMLAKAITIIKQSRPRHFVNQNKYICI